MNWDQEKVKNFLGARENNPNWEFNDAHRRDNIFLWFEDNTFSYYLHIQPKISTVVLAADHSEPLQGTPLLEYSFNCNIIEITETDIGLNHKRLCFFEHKNSEDGIRLSMSMRHDGNWYIWANVWQNRDKTL